MDINHPHASFAESVLKDAATSAEILQKLLPADVAKSIDWKTLSPQDNSFVDESLRNLYSDILFSATGTDGHPIELYLLLEHKSHPDKNILIQLLGYQREIYSKQKNYSQVISIVFYHGQEPWNIRTEFTEHQNALSRYALNFSYILIDLQKINFDSLHLSLTSRAILHIFQKIWTVGKKEKFQEYITIIKDLILAEDAITLLQKIFVYIYAVHEIKPETAKKTIEALVSKEKGDLAMTTAQLLVEQGMQQGMQKGMQQGELRRALETARNMIAMGLSMDIITRATGLSEKVLRENKVI